MGTLHMIFTLDHKTSTTNKKIENHIANVAS